MGSKAGDVESLLVERTASDNGSKEHLSLKRMREGSLEPSAEPPTPSITTKKNRLAPGIDSPKNGDETSSSPLIDTDTEIDPNHNPNNNNTTSSGILPNVPELAEAEEKDLEDDNDTSPPKARSKEGKNVGEVRRKVEKMSHEELGSTAAAASAKAENGGGGGGKEVQGKIGEDWEEIDEKEASDTEDMVASMIATNEAGQVEVKTAGDNVSAAPDNKRKQLDRSQSSYAQEEESSKKLKDASPPKESASSKPQESSQVSSETVPAPAPAPTKKPQATFSSFSSSASPFSATKSSNPFATASTTSSTTAPSAANKSVFGGSGFGNYSSTSSPFASKPSSGTGKPSGGFGFGGSSKPRAENNGEGDNNDNDNGAGPSGSTVNQGGEKGEKPKSFGDILSSRAEVDHENEGEAKVLMTEQDVHTGEEDEETVYSTRTKLYVMQADGGWRERGVGTLRLNKRKSDGNRVRLVMRAEGVLRVILNVSLYVGMNSLQDGKYVRLTVFEDSEKRFITFRHGSNKAAQDLAEHIHEHIPLEPSGSKSPEPNSLV